MEVEIFDAYMHPHDNGLMISTARRPADGWRVVTCWPRFFDRDQAVIALRISWLLEIGHRADDPVAFELRQALR